MQREKIIIEIIDVFVLVIPALARKIGVKDEYAGQSPAAKPLFKRGCALVGFIGLYAQRVKFIFELHDQLVQDPDVRF